MIKIKVMTTIIIGLFPTQKDAKNLAVDLEKVGFQNEDYIIYVNQKEEEKLNFWETLFGGRTPQININETDKLIASVSIKNEEQLRLTKEIFANHATVHTYEFDDVTINEAKSLDYLKTKVALRAKSAVYSSKASNIVSVRKMHADLTTEFA